MKLEENSGIIFACLQEEHKHQQKQKIRRTGRADDKFNRRHAKSKYHGTSSESNSQNNTGQKPEKEELDLGGR